MKSNKLLPIFKHLTSVKSIQSGAIFSRDWAPLHSNQDWAINKGNLPNIIMNNYTLNGLLIKYVTDIYGPSTRIGKVSFSIKKPICPDYLIEFHGNLENEKPINDDLSLLTINIDIKVFDQTFSSAKVVAGVNSTENEKNSPWNIGTDIWKSYLE